MTLEERRQASARYKEYRKRWYTENKQRVYQQVMEYRRRNPDKVKAWAKRDNERQRANGYKAQKECHQRRLAWYRDLKAGLSCSHCSESHPATLDFHHNDPKQKEFHIGQVGRYRNREKLLAEIAKCLVLCNNCHRMVEARRRKRIPANRDEDLADVFARQDRQYAWFQKIKRQHSCVDCEESHPVCLDFHHIDPTTKEFSIGQKCRTYSKERIIAEIKKCICLCSNCHRKLHWEERQAKLPGETAAA